MALPVVYVASGGIAVTAAANGFGTPIEEASNGLGVGVTFTGSGFPVVGGPGAGYVLLRGQNADGSYSILRGKNADGSYTSLAGK